MFVCGTGHDYLFWGATLGVRLFVLSRICTSCRPPAVSPDVVVLKGDWALVVSLLGSLSSYQ